MPFNLARYQSNLKQQELTAGWDLVKKSPIHVGYDKELLGVAKIGNQVVGSLFGSIDSKEFSFDIVVGIEWQGHGIGSLLLDQALVECREQERAGKKIHLFVVNQWMRDKLQTKGFQVIQNVGQKAWVMEKPETHKRQENHARQKNNRT